MKTQINQKRTTYLFVIVVIFSAVSSIFAQNPATKRLYLAVNGYELNEAAAKDALEAGADINWHNDAMGGETMLIMAIKGFKDAKTVKFLLDNGADASLKDDSGKTALEWARQYNFGRNRNGKEVLAMLEAATGQMQTVNTENNVADTKPTVTTKTTKSLPTKTAMRQADGKPAADEIRAMLEEKFTSIYEDHYCCKEKNKVEFEWLAPIQIGGQEMRGRIPVSCWAAKIDVKVTFTKQSSGETGAVRRGINGNPVKEGFCIYRDAYDQWDYLTYAP